VQLALASCNMLLAFAVYRLLGRFAIPQRLALLGALLYLAYPSKVTTMFWPTSLVPCVSLWAMLNSYLRHLAYVEGGDRRSLAVSAALLALSASAYDQALPLVAAWWILPRDGGPDSRVGLRRSFATAVAVLATYGLYRGILIPAVSGSRIRR